ncbi:MAG TPA: hypothetical protein VHB79_35835 [Polyangiaceae bacterium]|nr:hypothetical protein [Polyangiaceae bacterium]
MKSFNTFRQHVQNALSLTLLSSAVCCVGGVGCSSDPAASGDGSSGSAGTVATAGSGSGGTNPTGGVGGSSAQAGTAAGGITQGGSAQGGSAQGGTAQGGTAQGGSAAGGAAAGGTSPTTGGGGASAAGTSGGGQAGGAATDTWDSYAKSFTATYCVSCHNDDNAGTATRDYHMLAAVKAESVKIACGVSKSQADWSARGCTGGPAARQFPAGGGAKPMDAERDRFIKWIDAGMP